VTAEAEGLFVRWTTPLLALLEKRERREAERGESESGSADD
jgi:hypothetical protein